MDYKSKALKFIQEWKWAMVLLSICIIGIPLTTIYGVRSVAWGNGFWPNAFSEFLGMFVDLIFGAIFTLVVIDKYIQYHKNSQWKKIKENTYKNLYFILSNILLKLNWAFPKEVRIGSEVNGIASRLLRTGRIYQYVVKKYLLQDLGFGGIPRCLYAEG